MLGCSDERELYCDKPFAMSVWYCLNFALYPPHIKYCMLSTDVMSFYMRELSVAQRS